MVRVVESRRWSLTRIQRMKVEPLTDKPHTYDHIEDDNAPHKNPDIPHDAATDEGPELACKRAKISLKDLQHPDIGFTEAWPTCNLHRCGDHARANHAHHTEACRARVYDALKKLGSTKIIQAESEGRTLPKATQTKHKSEKEQTTTTSASSSADPAPAAVLETCVDHGVALDVDAVLPSKDPDDNEFSESADLYNQMIDVLQILGVDCVSAAGFVNTLRPTDPVTFMEVYGQGRIVKEANGGMHKLDVKGLAAFDLRTTKPNGENWDFTKAQDRDEARAIVMMVNPKWLIGSPPCTDFCP